MYSHGREQERHKRLAGTSYSREPHGSRRTLGAERGPRWRHRGQPAEAAFVEMTDVNDRPAMYRPACQWDRWGEWDTGAVQHLH